MPQPRAADTVVDVAIIGAGLAGLACAQQLQQHGLTVELFDKSRGLGGRLATRRVQSAWMDHGVRYWQAQGEQTQALLRTLLAHDIVRLWTSPIGQLDQAGQVMPFDQDGTHHLPYVSPVGLTAIAKFMAQDLTIHRSQRAIALATRPTGTWHIRFDAEPETVAAAKAVVLAIPAPQALPLLQPLVTDGLPPEIPNQIQAVEFDPCISVMAGYSRELWTGEPSFLGQWQALKLADHPDLAWISLEQSKADQADQPLLLVQSTATVAEQYLEADDLQPTGQALLAALAALDRPEWAKPDWMQVHRWRYAFTRRPLGQPWLAATAPLPLVCCGDWCLGDGIEEALQSGTAAAMQLLTLQ